MATKDEARNKLKKAGYNIVDDNAVITILVPPKTNIKNVVKDVKELMLKIDYKASFGVKQTDASLEENTVEFEGDDEVLEEETIEEVKEAETAKKESTSKIETKKEDADEFFDDEDENLDNIESNINLDSLDMDMLLNEESVQFSLEDFGMM